MTERFVPGDFAPGVRDLGPDHRLQDAVPVGGIAPSKAALDAGMAVVCLAVLVRNQANKFLAPHFRLEAAADPAISAGRDRRMFRLADLDHRFLDERGSRARLDAGAARYAFGFKEGLRLPGRNPASEPASIDRERKGTLDFLASTNATVADDAFRWIVAEIRVRFVLLVGEVVVALVAVAHIAQPDVARFRLQFAIAVGGAGQAIERMVGDIKLHHALAESFQPLGLGVDDHARRDRGGARSGGSSCGLGSRPGKDGRSRTLQCCRWRRVLGFWSRLPSPPA